MTKIASFLSKQTTGEVDRMRRKMLFTIFNISFRSIDIQVLKICELAKWWRHTLNQILFEYDEKRYLSQLASEMFDSLL